MERGEPRREHEPAGTGGEPFDELVVPLADVDRLHEIGYKTVGVANDRTSADMHLRPDDVGAFKTRIWELFRPGN